VLNNPINASDPSGHKCTGEPDECLKDNGKKGAGFTGTGSQGDYELPSPTGGDGGSSNNRDNDKRYRHYRKDKPTYIPTFDNQVGENYLPPVADPKTNPEIPDQLTPIDEIFFIIDFGTEALDLLDLIEDGILWGRPLYRQVKYAIPLGGLEYGIDAGLQLYDDRNMNLTLGQRGIRAGVRFLESWAIDSLSFGVGLAAGTALQVSAPEAPVVGAGAGFVIGSYATSAILDNAAKQLNPGLFNMMGLGGSQ